MTGSKVRMATAPGSVEELRPEAVQMAVDSLEAMGLTVDEELAVVCFLQGKLMAREGTTVVVRS